MTHVAPPIADEYEAALRDYLQGSGEAALQRAYEVGRRAVREGFSLFDLISRHHAALGRIIRHECAAVPIEDRFEAAQTFLAESLSTYEMAHREFRDAISALRQLNERLEEEAQRIAHALHDDAGQLLVSVHLALHQLAREHPIVGDRIRMVRAQLDAVEQQIRRLAYELRPMVLDDLGLLPAVEALAAGVTDRTGIPIEIHGVPEGRLPGAVEATIYRVVQEALTNATRHGRPRHVWITMERGRGRVRWRVRDDGVGFDVQAILDGRRRSGLGLPGMRHRLAILGGRLTIHSAPGRGCELLLDIPVEVCDGDPTLARG